MPEYLSPGVYIEETSYRGKPIEGVSTSTAGFVGRAKMGPPGRPVLVTSFNDFVRSFGAPYANPDSDSGEQLGHAVRGFFENGGSRAWIVRVLGENSGASTATGAWGNVLRLASRAIALEGATTFKLNSLRGVTVDTVLTPYSRESSQLPFAALSPLTVNGYDPVRQTVTVSGALPQTLKADHAYFVVGGAPPADASDSSNPELVFTARDEGAAGDELSALITPTDRPVVRVESTVDSSSTSIDVATTSGFYVGAIVELDNGAEKFISTVSAIDAGATPKTVSLDSYPASVFDGTSGSVYIRVLEFNLDVLEGGSVVESFSNLSWNPDPNVASITRYFADVVSDSETGSRRIEVACTQTGAGLAAQPCSPDGQPIQLSNGSDGDAPEDTHFIGADNGPGQRTGIEALNERDDVSMVAVPGVTSEAVQSQLITHCELQKYRVAVLDARSDDRTVADIQAHRNAYDSSRAAYYAPWLQALELSTGRTIEVPPSGHMMGIYARSDNERGVHKAPANEIVRGITGLTLPFTKGEQEVLNPEGVNLVREFDRRGTRLWGARTISSDPEWKYLNVRRLFIFLEASIDRSTQWVVFEPNNEALWAKVVSTIESFLFSVWRTGALMGTTPQEAFFVRCDRSTMTLDDIDNGRLIVQIGVAPTKPAEFVIFRIGQFTSSAPAS